MSPTTLCQLLFACCIIFSVTTQGSSQQCPLYEYPVPCKNFCQRCEYKNGGCSQGTVCVPGCDCVPGYFRNSQDQCIWGDLCPPTTVDSPQQCPLYEYPVPCKDFCQRCEYKNGGCAQPAVCIPGCDCVPGYFRNSQDQCIWGDLCPGATPTQQCPPGEMPGCIDKCQRCEYIGKNCTQTPECNPGCNCVPGFFRDGKNFCIPEYQCPRATPTQQCPPGEIPGCIDKCQKCEFKDGNCVQTLECIPGCNCLPGFFRNEYNDNRCVAKFECPP